MKTAMWIVLTSTVFLLAGCVSSGPTGGDPGRCEKLQARMAELKGKPQRRKAVSDQYDVECRGRGRAPDLHPPTIERF